MRPKIRCGFESEIQRETTLIEINDTLPKTLLRDS